MADPIEDAEYQLKIISTYVKDFGYTFSIDYVNNRWEVVFTKDAGDWVAGEAQDIDAALKRLFSMMRQRHG